MTFHILFEWIVVVYISVQITTISFEWIVVINIFVRMTTISFRIDCCDARFCANDYHFFLNGFSSCTFLCEWLPSLFEWIFVMHLSVQMTTNSFIWVFVMHIMYKWLSIFFVFGFSSCTFLWEWHSIFFWFFHVCNALQRVNSMVQWRIINDNIMYIGFYHVLNAF